MPAIPPTKLRLIELFSSIQGEGLLLGRRQLFLRLANCNLNCAYCDTPFQPGPVWRAETAPGSGEFESLPNPVASQHLAERIGRMQQQAPIHHSLALTGGEPLLQAQELTGFLPLLAGILPVFLETNGTLPESLMQILPWVRWISMDIKLESSSGSPTPWQSHAHFMTAAGAALCQVKLVIVPQTPVAEITRAAHMVAEFNPELPLILQPRTSGGKPSVSGAYLLSLQAIAGKIHAPTLVIPQLHPLLAVP